MPCACSLAQVHQLLCDLGPAAAPFRALVSPSVKQRAWVRGCPAALSAATPPEARSPAPPSGSDAGSPSLPGRAAGHTWGWAAGVGLPQPPQTWSAPPPPPACTVPLPLTTPSAPAPPSSLAPSPYPCRKSREGGPGSWSLLCPTPTLPSTAVCPHPTAPGLPGSQGPRRKRITFLRAYVRLTLPVSLSRPPTHHQLSRPSPAHPSVQEPQTAWNQPGLGTSPTCTSPICLL